MFYNPYYFTSPPPIPYQSFSFTQMIPRTYPPVNINILKSSIQSFPLLMEQGSILLKRLSNDQFAMRIMRAAQEGKQADVDQLLRSIGLKVPVRTRYTPTGVNFELYVPAKPGTTVSCCSLTISAQWGR